MISKNKSIKILFVGDIVPGGVLPYQKKYIDEKILTYMRLFNLRVGTLECGVGTNLAFDELKYKDDMSNIFVRNEDIFRLKEMDINIVTIANNHAFDLGLTGFENMIHQLDQMGIKHCGAGHNIEEASQPVVINIYGKSFAFLGCMINPPCVRMYHVATKENYGVFQVDIDFLCRTIVELKTQYDHVFVLPHWGIENSYYPPNSNKEYAYKMIEAGADAIMGSHPHIVNPVVKYRGKPIYYSLGNFLFPDKCMQVPRPMYYPLTVKECHSLKRVWTYPYRIKDPVLAVWRGKNRIGMMGELNIYEKGSISSNYRFSMLTSDNILKLYYNRILKLRILILGIIIKMSFYKFLRKYLASRYNYIAIFLNKFCSINVIAKEYESA